MDSPSSHEFDLVKAEKAKAMRRYRRSRKLKNLAHALELLVALLLLSWCSSGLSASAGDFLRRLASLLAKPLVVFLISNGIIVIILFSAGKNDDLHEPSHFYDEYLSARRSSAGGSEGTVAAPDETLMDKQIVLYEAPPAHEKFMTEASLPMPESDPLPSTVDPAVEKDADEEDAVPEAAPRASPAAGKLYRRTRSEVTGEEEPRAELRRSATDNGRAKPPPGGDEEGPSSVEELSNEEFNLTVEEFIEKRRWFLREEFMAEDAVLSVHSVAVN